MIEFDNLISTCVHTVGMVKGCRLDICAVYLICQILWHFLIRVGECQSKVFFFNIDLVSNKVPLQETLLAFDVIRNYIQSKTIKKLYTTSPTATFGLYFRRVTEIWNTLGIRHVSVAFITKAQNTQENNI